MVTNEIEKNRMKCHRYWPDPTSSPPVKKNQYGAVFVTHLNTVPHKHFMVRTFEVEFEGEKRNLKQFAYTSWPDHGVPLTTQELLGFRNAIRSSVTKPEVPQVIHCSAGVGRTGTYIALDRCVAIYGVCTQFVCAACRADWACTCLAALAYRLEPILSAFFPIFHIHVKRNKTRARR